MPATKEEKLTAYPPPKYLTLVRAEAKADNCSVSKIVNKALKMYYDSLTVEQKANLLNRSALNSKNSY